MRYIFIALYGWNEQAIKQPELVHKIAEGIECWDLKKCSLEEFVAAIQAKIPPINERIRTAHYIANPDSDYGVTKEQYAECTWGLLLPDPIEHGSSYKEVVSVLNLFSFSFLRPAFYVSDFGIQVVNKKPLGNWLNAQHRSGLFNSPNFPAFYEKMIPATRYFQWFRDNVLAWDDEDWRLYMAASFYDGLEGYENSKSIYMWQRESADMATLLETLLTAGESEKEEIGYRLRKRAFALIGWRIPSIEKDIKDLYKDRSDFVHGNFFKKIVKGMKKNKDGDPAMPPSPDFVKLYQLKERVRFIFVAYLYLNEVRLAGTVEAFAPFENVQKILEEAITDTELRKTVHATVQPVVDLLPESTSGHPW